ncbi:MAG TPA: choice-of-anchor J domain-containing protein [Anaerolineales bacterium]
MEKSSNQSSNTPKIIAAILGVLVVCSCFAIVAAAVIGYQAFQSASPEISTAISPTEEFTTPKPMPTLERPSTDSISTETLETLGQTLVPENDPYELACRLEKICNVSETIEGKTYQVGDKEKFWILNSDTVEHHQIDATLLYITPHSYFWAEEGADVNQSDMKALMDTFENEIYPTNREFFGSEWTPGVDGDEHIYVLYASGLGENVAGYFNSSDSFNPVINEYSNGHETFVFSTKQDLGNEFTYSVLAHEFVHMIQFPSDRNDETWLTEGFADVGSFINGYGVGNHDWLYVQDPDLQLTDWSPEPGTNAPHYGQSFLYLAYFLDRFGEEATKALTNNPENGLPSVDGTLAELNITDPQTGQPVTADDIFMDWAATLYLMDGSVGDGRYDYNNYPGAPQYSPNEFISNCPQSLDGSVNQYGIDYYPITCIGDFTLHFSGSTVVGLLPADAHSGDYAFWSNKGDESDMTLTREFDFTGISGPINFSYWTWYDIEENWDYLHLEVSTDGQNWEIITTPSGTDYNPSGNSYGWGYTGQSGGWKLEEIDLSQFAGQKVQIRFEYVTDAAVNGEGLLLDDISIDAINYQSDFEADEGGWEAAGFVRVENVLPQTYRLALITRGDTTTVTHIELDEDQTAEIPLSLNAGDEVVLVVTGTTRFTRQPAAYQIEIR